MNSTDLKPTFIKIKIKDADVFLENLGKGKGKITISSLNYGSFNFFWGSMGSNLEEFILSINSDYFASKLSTKSYTFDPKGSTKSLRKHIREELSYDLPYYKFMTAQKEMRKAIKKLEFVSSADEFISRMIDIPDNLMCFDLNHQEEKEFKSIIRGLFFEPWHFISEKHSKEYDWLYGFHKELKKHLKSNKILN